MAIDTSAVNMKEPKTRAGVFILADVLFLSIGMLDMTTMLFALPFIIPVAVLNFFLGRKLAFAERPVIKLLGTYALLVITCTPIYLVSHLQVDASGAPMLKTCGNYCAATPLQASAVLDVALTFLLLAFFIMLPASIEAGITMFKLRKAHPAPPLSSQPTPPGSQ